VQGLLVQRLLLRVEQRVGVGLARGLELVVGLLAACEDLLHVLGLADAHAVVAHADAGGGLHHVRAVAHAREAVAEDLVGDPVHAGELDGGQRAEREHQQQHAAERERELAADAE